MQKIRNGIATRALGIGFVIPRVSIIPPVHNATPATDADCAPKAAFARRPALRAGCADKREDSMKIENRFLLLAVFWAALGAGLAGFGCGGRGGCPAGQIPDPFVKFGIAAEDGCVFTCLGNGDCPSGQFCDDPGPIPSISGICEACSPEAECASDADCGTGGSCVGCSCSGGSPGCTPAFDVAGIWNSAFLCTESGGSCFTGSDSLAVTQNGAAVSYRDEAERFSANGSLCGNIFTWSGATDADVTPGFSESGTWTFSDAKHFNKTSTFMGNDGRGGECAGNGAESPESPVTEICP